VESRVKFLFPEEGERKKSHHSGFVVLEERREKKGEKEGGANCCVSNGCLSSFLKGREKKKKGRGR